MDVINNQPRKRLEHLDLLRILAIFMVVFNHTGERGYMLCVGKSDELLYFPYMACSVLCKIAVPLFFMISGALLLPKQESLKTLFSKRVLRIAMVLVLISLPFYVWLHSSKGLGIGAFFTYIYGNSASTSLWYLYSYLSLLLFLPFLRSMVKKMTEKDFAYLIAGHLALGGVLPCLEYLLWQGEVTLHKSFESFIFISQSAFFSLIGYYVEYVLNKKYYCKKFLLLGSLLSVVSLMVTCFITHYQTLQNPIISTEQTEAFFNCFISIPAMTIYFGIKLLSVEIKGQKVKKVISVFGESVFGVYLIEKFIRALTNPVYSVLSPWLGSFVSALLWALVTCLVGFVIVIPLKHIPIVSKLINKFI